MAYQKSLMVLAVLVVVIGFCLEASAYGEIRAKDIKRAVRALYGTQHALSFEKTQQHLETIKQGLSDDNGLLYLLNNEPLYQSHHYDATKFLRMCKADKDGKYEMSGPDAEEILDAIIQEESRAGWDASSESIISYLYECKKRRFGSS